ncbi:hypothetical protein DSECCO2_253100 [anaerobic digester metagenome]
MLDEYIDWDVDEEMGKNRVRADRILKDFSDVEGLGEVLSGVLGLMDSEVYNRVYLASDLGEEISNFAPPSREYLFEHYKQDQYACTILRKPVLNLFTDNVILQHYLATSGTIGFVHHAYKGFKLSLKDLDKEYVVFERLMVLLDDFDSSVGFHPPDEDFYRKLKNIKWDKNAKKLYGGILRIIRDITLVKWGTNSSTFGSGENFTLTFLAACNAVVHGRNKILPEDVSISHKTHLKLLNTDINNLG